MKISLAFTDLSVIEEVSIPLWRELFEAVGWLESLRAKRDVITHDDIVAALQQDTPSDGLLQALEALHNLGTSEGREAINALLAERQLAPTAIPQDLGERELALRLFLAQREDSALAEIFSRAQVQLQEGNHRRFNDFTAKETRRILDLPTKRQALEAAILAHCQETDLGNHVQVRTFDDDDGACRFQIMRSHHLKTPLAVTKGATARAKIEYRPVHADFLRYEPALGRLRITARAASIVEFYRQTFGRVMFEDVTFFYGPHVCSLDVLQEKGPAALTNHGVYNVGRVWMTECVWERGDREKLVLHAADCFASIERLGISLSEGQILQAKFKIEVIGKSTRPVTVKVRAPSRIEVSQVRHEALVNEVLEAIGIRNKHVREEEHNLWTLYPWRQPIDAWRACFGAHADTLVGKGALTKTQLTSIEPTAHPGAGRILQAEQLSPVEFLGVSQTPEIPSQSLSATDLDGLELSVPALQRHLRDLLEITGNVHSWSDGSWCLDLGVLSLDEIQIRIFYALRQPPHDAAENIRNLSGGILPVLLLPTSHKASTGLTEVLLDTALPGDRQRIIRDAIAASNLTAQVSARWSAPLGTRLVMDTQRAKVWFDGVEITDLKPETQAYRFVQVMASNAPGTAINKHDLTEKLSPGRIDGDQTARSAKASANRSIKAALEASGKNFEDPFRSENGSYRLTVPPWVV